ncbi:glycine--tRNA ligase subunit beta [Loktanella sp. F6476L]|uniref:glycine--tRNA ligase subunit beta n=1 Tax=Loktanella sp. F6476L TaxID=2926405 RepID=UPI001FF43547|nr:glycine--tRNA ligase subunit beta [Loktanella sp. F6476L]MCK0121003.1 glycine--tRNA ligase subunit beta [Loktanella sp. F6476L]
MADLLIELFSEEIPARMQAKAAKDLQKLVTDGLVEAGLTYAGAAAFATPRRLALSLEGLTSESKAVREERKGPATTAPDKALEGFLRSTGLTKDQLEIRDVKKGQVYFAVVEKPGRMAADIIAEVLEKTIRNFPWPKSMRWGEGALKWVRPLHSIICILSDEAGAEIVPLDIDGIKAGNQTRGHRFMAPDAFSVVSFEDYEAKLKRAKVVLRAEERAELIWHDATNQAFAQGLEIVEDRGLLAEVANLVEWPVTLMGTIADDFLEMPPEVLQTSMKDHQKFFSVRNPKTNRIERFVTVANIETKDDGATILAGNQKVLFARLFDAKFFWENDLRVAKAGMAEWTEGLKAVTFHNKLGSQFDRVERIVALAREIAPVVGADADDAAEAARIAKADLRSEMIYEFPELQGLMGRYYAKSAGASDAVAAAAQEHYSPLGPSDDVPTAPVSVTVALADKLDTLTGFWAIDEKPTGSKDPFALRRSALGVIRLILTNNVRMSLDKAFDAEFLRHEIRSVNSDVSEPDLHTMEETLREISEHGIFKSAFLTVQKRFDGAEVKPDFSEGSWIDGVAKRVPDTSLNLLSFFHDRLKVFLKDQGIRHDIIDACIAMPGNDDLTLLVKRAQALAETLKTDDGENLIQGFKRANNILTQAEEKDGVEYSYGADLKYAEHDSEKALFAALDAADAKIAPAMQAEDFSTAMTAMAELRGPIDAFFTDVQVNADATIVRRNRLNLLSRIRTICLSVADLTLIEG